MLYAVLFIDDPQKADARARLMPEHLSFLCTHQDQIHAAGPLFEITDGRGAGGLWLVEAADAQSVEKLIHEDPFWPTGLRQSFRILHWRQVHPSAST